MVDGSNGEARPSAAVLLIGDELLSGKIRDENGFFLTGVLRRRGIPLAEMTVVPDDLDTIGSALLRLLETSAIVFTSGGVGPTHDDLTMEAIARATNRPLERNPRMQAILEAHYGNEITAAALSMADLPRGTTLRAEPGWPVMRLDIEPSRRVYILPGIPGLLRAKVEALEALPDELPVFEAWDVQTLETTLEEASLAPILDEVVRAFPKVAIGSYPRWDPDAAGRLHQVVRVTLESTDPAASKAARARLLSTLGEARIDARG